MTISNPMDDTYSSPNPTPVQTSSWLSEKWVMIAATVQGPNHLLEAIPCQDTHAFIPTAQGLIVAVSDGLGSARLSQVGAQLAVKEALKRSSALLAEQRPDRQEGWTEVLRKTFLAARNALLDKALAQGHHPDDYAATLIVAVIDEGWQASAMIGDGAVVKMDDDDACFTVCAPQTGEFANETFSITAPDGLERMVYHVSRDPLKNLGIITDGLQRIAIHQHDNSPHVPFFAPLFRQLDRITDGDKAAHALADFLDSEKVRKLSGDDKTLVLIGRKSTES